MRTLVHINGDDVTWSAAVTRVAEAINPIGTAARVVVSLGACAVEIRQIQLEQLKVQHRYELLDSTLRQRQSNIAWVFDGQLRRANQERVTHQQLQLGHEAALRLGTDFGISEDERMIAQQTAMFYATSMVNLHVAGSNELVRLTEALNLGEIRAIVSPWRQIER